MLQAHVSRSSNASQGVYSGLLASLARDMKAENMSTIVPVIHLLRSPTVTSPFPAILLFQSFNNGENSHHRIPPFPKPDIYQCSRHLQSTTYRNCPSALLLSRPPFAQQNQSHHLRKVHTHQQQPIRLDNHPHQHRIHRQLHSASKSLARKRKRHVSIHWYP